MKKTCKIALCLLLVLSLMLSACGKQSASAPASAPAPTADTAPAIVPDSTVAIPTEKQEIAGTIIGASMNNVIIRTADGVDLDFLTTDAQIEAVDGLLEGDWVCIEYVGTINGTDTTGTVVQNIKDDDAHVKEGVENTKFADGAKKMFTTGPLHVRSDYSKAGKILGTLPKGTEVEILGEAPNGWKKIKYEGKDSYVFGDYLTPTAPKDLNFDAIKTETVAPMSTYVTVYPVVNLRIRGGPNTDADVYGMAKAGTPLTQTGTLPSGWIQILYNGVAAYCDGEYITAVAPGGAVAPAPSAGIPAGVNSIAADAIYYTTVNLKIHMAPTMDAASIGVAPKGTALHCTGILDNHFSQVSYAGKTGYCVSQYLSTEAVQPDAPKNSVTFADNKGDVYTIADLRVREQPSAGGRVMATMPVGTKVFRYAVSSDGKWSKIDYEGFEYYCATQYLSSTAPITSETGTTVNENVTTTANLRMHSGQSTDAQILGTVPVGTVLNRIAVYSTGWSVVMYNGQPAFCASSYLK
ncbi:MAG: SH3 domain-containing protein [Ruthenibacterium sp.]